MATRTMEPVAKAIVKRAAMRLAPDQVRKWIDKRPEPDSVAGLGVLLPAPMSTQPGP